MSILVKNAQSKLLLKVPLCGELVTNIVHVLASLH